MDRPVRAAFGAIGPGRGTDDMQLLPGILQLRRLAVLCNVRSRD